MAQGWGPDREVSHVNFVWAMGAPRIPLSGWPPPLLPSDEITRPTPNSIRSPSLPCMSIQHIHVHTHTHAPNTHTHAFPLSLSPSLYLSLCLQEIGTVHVYCISVDRYTCKHKCTRTSVYEHVRVSRHKDTRTT